MKNINKHKTPQDKMKAWYKWRVSHDGCQSCHVKCDTKICFNAWLHSTTGQRAVKEQSMRKIKEECQ